MTPQLALSRAYLASRTLKHGERPTPRHLRVLRRLVRHPDNIPSHRTLALQAKVCIRTVGNALRRAADLGLLSWTKRGTTLPDGRVWQLPNRYTFLNSLCFLFAPPRPKQPREKVLFLCTPENWVGKLAPEEHQALLVKWGLAPVNLA
jgi:hypothetical protein